MAQTLEETELITKIESSEDTQEKEKLYVELINKVRRHSADSAYTYIAELKALNNDGNCATCYIQGLFMEGHVLFSQDSLDRALEAYEKTKEEADKIKDVSLFLLANLRASAVLKRMGRFKEAQGTLLKTLSGVKDSIKTHGLKVFVDQVTGDLDEARIKEELREERRKNRERELQLKNERKIWVASGIVLLLLFGGLIFMLISKRRRDKMELELLSSKMNTLKSQMNPHFIFNCVNSIKGLVVSNQNEKAADYLTDFSRLTRMILEQSSYDSITLKEELEFLEVYVKTEKQREIVHFEFDVILGDGIESEEVMVFPFLLQPFVENVVKHAFVDVSKEENRLTVRVMKGDDDWILFEVEDNGIGVPKKSDHHSKGMELIKQRLELINKVSENVTTVFRGENNGTIVKLRLRNK